MFSVFARSGNGFHRDSSLIISLLSVAGFSVLITVSFDEDVEVVGEDEVEQLVDKPGTTHGTQFDIMQSILLPFLVRCVSDRWSSGKYSHDLRRASRVKELQVCLQETHCHEFVQFFDICFFPCSHLAVGRHHRRRTSRCPHGLQFGRVKVSLADNMHACSGIYYKLSFLRLFSTHSSELARESSTNSLSSGLMVDAAGIIHSLVGV